MVVKLEQQIELYQKKSNYLYSNHNNVLLLWELDHVHGLTRFFIVLIPEPCLAPGAA
jgi:hypothetical protein